eukprot:3441949-Rhodomonas_salina.1
MRGSERAGWAVGAGAGDGGGDAVPATARRLPVCRLQYQPGPAGRPSDIGHALCLRYRTCMMGVLGTTRSACGTELLYGGRVLGTNCSACGTELLYGGSRFTGCPRAYGSAR